MKKLRNEEGIALITALMFTLITLGMIMALMQMLLMETKMSASQKSYHNSLEASYGGTEVVTKEIIPRLANYSTGVAPLISAFSGTNMGNFNLALNMNNPVKDPIKIKLQNNTSDWAGLGLTSMQTQTATQKLDPKYIPDFQFQLKGNSSGVYYKVYAKIVDTVSGNSDMTGIDFLDSGAGVTGAGSGVSPKHNPSLYTIEVQGERANNPKEKAKLSVLYAY
ncbi:MAG TPA: pilus assembly PilX N-terminal domain-containing protein [Geomonas sp.]|nr:pilus assembly PilX N-terminal domain-containing protein [Geomonas sp.]